MDPGRGAEVERRACYCYNTIVVNRHLSISGPDDKELYVGSKTYNLIKTDKILENK